MFINLFIFSEDSNNDNADDDDLSIEIQDWLEDDSQNTCETNNDEDEDSIE